MEHSVGTLRSEPSTPQRQKSNASYQPQTPGSDTYSHSSYSAFSGTPTQKLQPIHLNTVGRRELLQWVNETLDLDLADISQANNGAVACQMLDRLNPVNPTVINMRKVDFNANSPYYIEANWRILQRAFVELDIDWNVDVERCQQGHQMDLLLLFRWFKQRSDAWEVELRGRGEELPPYDAKARRALSKTGDSRDHLARLPSVTRSASRPRTPALQQHRGKGGKARLGDDDSAREYGSAMANSGTQIGASFKKGQKKPSLWKKLKLALKS